MHGLANIYMTLGEYPTAIKNFKECLTYDKDNEITIGSNVNLGIIYALKKDFETSTYYFKKVKSFFKHCYRVTIINMYYVRIIVSHS